MTTEGLTYLLRITVLKEVSVSITIWATAGLKI